jgi:hypothetical protein
MASVFALIFLVGYTNPNVISPLPNYETTETEILFSIEKADKILVDDNLEFTTPEEYFVKDGLEISLVPGTYYWKAIGIRESEIRTLTIKSKVSLELRKVSEGFDVVNSGNVRLNVEVYNGSQLVDNLKLEKGDSVSSKGNKFLGWLDG